MSFGQSTTTAQDDIKFTFPPSQSGVNFPVDSLNAFDACEDRHFWFTTRKILIGSLIRQYLPTDRSLRIMDIGCGNGGLIRYLQDHFPDAALAGVDIYPEALEHTRKRSQDALLFLEDIARLDRLSIEAPYDVIIFADVLEHLDDPDSALRQAATLLRPGGIIIGAVPSSMHLWSERDVFLGHRLRYSRVIFESLFARNRYRILSSNYAFSFLYPLALFNRKILARIVKKRGRDIERGELRVVPGVNAFLGWCGRCEVALARYVRLPFGTTTYCVARKE